MTTERELALELRVKQLEGALISCRDKTDDYADVVLYVNKALQAPTPDPSPVMALAKAVVSAFYVLDMEHRDCLMLEAVEALPADLRQLLEGGK